MSERIVQRFRVFCIPEARFHHMWRGQDEGPPSKCPNGHTDINAISKTDEIREAEVKIQEETIPTGGHYQEHSYKITCPPSQSTAIDISFPYDIGVVAVYTLVDEKHRGDIIQLDIGPDTIVGPLNATTAVEDTVIDVGLSSVQLLYVGLWFRLWTPPATFSTYTRVIAVDRDAGTVTLESPVGAVYSSTNTYMQVVTRPVVHMEISAPGRYGIGENKIGASHIPANTVMRVTYTNVSTTETTDFVFYNQYLY